MQFAYLFTIFVLQNVPVQGQLSNPIMLGARINGQLKLIFLRLHMSGSPRFPVEGMPMTNFRFSVSVRLTIYVCTEYAREELAEQRADGGETGADQGYVQFERGPNYCWCIVVLKSVSYTVLQRGRSRGRTDKWGRWKIRSSRRKRGV